MTKTALSIFIILILLQTMTLFNFNKTSDLTNWKIIDDVVMGGQSNGSFKINENGHGAYTGNVSLKKNGGFSSLHYYFDTIHIEQYSKFLIKIKGDGKTYQFRVKNKQTNRHSYIFQFSTNQDWQTIEIPFNKMSAAFRGRQLEIPNFEGVEMEEIAFLIGNKKEENFKLLIDSIYLE